jgi:uncharacterized protein (TIGR02145 family)
MIQVRMTVDGQDYEGSLAPVGGLSASPPASPVPVSPASAEFFSDPRDGREYRFVKIGSQVWMAENLNYPADGSVCYRHNPETGDLYGRLYHWAAAVGACPPGWHLPSAAEWAKLAEFVGSGQSALLLKARRGWLSASDGEDRFGFAALPGGYRGRSPTAFHFAGRLCGWWTASEASEKKAYTVRLHSDVPHLHQGAFDKFAAFSVRCVKD